jgi:hypothetical protein
MRMAHWCGLALLWGLAGCGDDDGGSGKQTSELGRSCHSMCDAQYKDCPGSVGTCRQLCDAVVGVFKDDACRAKAKAYFDCGAGIEWTCQDLIAQQKDPDQCKAEQDAYVPCLQS